MNDNRQPEEQNSDIVLPNIIQNPVMYMNNNNVGGSKHLRIEDSSRILNIDDYVAQLADSNGKDFTSPTISKHPTVTQTPRKQFHNNSNYLLHKSHLLNTGLNILNNSVNAINIENLNQEMLSVSIADGDVMLNPTKKLDRYKNN